MRQQLIERDATTGALEPRQLGALVQLRPPGLHDAAERHAAGTDALAVATHQTQLEVLAVRRRRLDAALVERLNEVDTAARRLGLVAGRQIRRAVGQAQPAV